jgi:hypothetical protein
MKTKGFIIALSMFVASAATAQIPQNIKDAFRHKYPDATLKKFRHENKTYVALFVNGKENDKAVFSETGSWIKTVAPEKLNNLPDAVKTGLLKSRYDGWFIQECTQIKTPKGMLYSFDVTSPYTFTGCFKADNYVYFTPSGNLVKQ